MTVPPDPSAAPTQPLAAPKCALLAMCVECGEGAELLLPIDHQSVGVLLAQRGWFISVLTPPEQRADTPMVLGPLCAACAQKIYPPEVFAAAEQRRQQLMQAAAQVVQAAQVPR